MSTFDIVRAWKDTAYRKNLSIEAQELLTSHPAGTIELSEMELSMAGGMILATNSLPTVCGTCSYDCTETSTLDYHRLF